MNTERWRRVSPHLDRLLDLPEEEREAELAVLAGEDPELVAELAKLLGETRALRAEKFLEHDAFDLLADSPLEGMELGAYTLDRPLGSGGMGSVWLARRTDGRYEGMVAVKLLSAAFLGPAGASRFRREGSILARMRHPHIAQLIDAGVSANGHPYLVLEYVEGEPIDRWCDLHQLGVEARLHLFLDVLAAVAHAHSNLVVHRDLKPSNVMVSRGGLQGKPEGRVKLLDFGIAKLLAGDGDEAPTQLTRDAERFFTPAYAAPEQVTGEAVTTATDVYALGALLYLLLTGRPPAGEIGSSPAVLLRAIVETEPERPSDAVFSTRSGKEPERVEAATKRASTPERLRRTLRGDLDTLVSKALKKKPEERYTSVSAFAEDVRRYLAREPLAARPDSLAYRGRKFVQRHARMVTAAALASLALVGIVAFYTIRLAGERDRVRREAEKADQASEFLAGLLSHADPYEAGGKVDTVHGLLEAGAARAQSDLADQPELQREIYTLLGRIYDRRGEADRALQLLAQAVELGRKTLGPGPELAQSLHDLGVAQDNRGQFAAAHKTLTEALAMRRQFLGDEKPETAVTYSELGRVYFDLGRLDNAETYFRKALALRRKVLGPGDHDTATSLSDLGLLLRQKGDRADAEALLREALTVTRQTRDKLHPDVGTALANVALVVSERGNAAAAEKPMRESLAITRVALGEKHPDYAQRLSSLATVLRMGGKLAEAAAAGEDALARSRIALGPDHPNRARQEIALARVYLEQRRPAAAEPLLLHALKIQERAYPAGDRRLGITQSLLGAAYTGLGRYPEAEARLRNAELLLPLGTSSALATEEAAANRARLLALYTAWGQPQKAAQYRAPR